MVNVKTIRDERGFLIEYLKNKELKDMDSKFGQIYIATILPNNLRGNHYHKKKTELMSCVHGKVKVTLFDINTKEKKTLILDSLDEEIKRLLVKPEVVHLVENNFDETAVLVSHSSEDGYDKEDDYRYHLN